MKLPPRTRCMRCGGKLLSTERWYCWACKLIETMYPTCRQN